MKLIGRKIVVVNQATNYLTIGLCNEFAERFEQVALITGSVHSQGEKLTEVVDVCAINRWRERHGLCKIVIWLQALVRIHFLLLTRYRRYEVFFVSVPPMAYLLSLLLPQRCSVLIWDVYPDTLQITGMRESHLLYRTWAWLNRHCFHKMHRLFTIGEKMAGLLANYVPRDKIIVQPIWSIFQENKRLEKVENPFIAAHNPQKKFVVQYSGNIGLTHKVEVMIALAERMQDRPNILFQIIGRGPRVPMLKRLVVEKGICNCQFLPFQSDEMFPCSLSAADLGVVILDERTSKGSVPSKSYNLMSYGIPALYIAAADSELHEYAQCFGHAACFSETELEQAASFIFQLHQDGKLYRKMADSNLEAAKCFRRENASKFVSFYLEDKE